MNTSLRKQGLRILITTGPTREYIDPVRFISNQSTGRIGYLLAAQAQKRGHRVILLSGPTTLKVPAGVECHSFETAAELKTLALGWFAKTDAVIAAAAVGDFKPVRAATKKIKKKGKHVINLTLTSTPDILRLLGQRKTTQVLVGFCLETNRILHYARAKLQEKNLDLIVANVLSAQHKPFGAGYISGLIADTQNVIHLKRVSKSRVAAIILDRVEKLCYS